MKFVIFAVFSLNLFAYGKAFLPVCERTQKIQDMIVKKIQREYSTINCSSADQLLDYIEILDFNDRLRDITSLKAGDFSGLTSLKKLDLYNNKLGELPAGVFSGLISLEWLALANNELSELPAGVFSGLTSLEWLDLGTNELSLSAGVFSDLSSLKLLSLVYNNLSALPPGVFSDLSSLQELGLEGNPLPRSEVNRIKRELPSNTTVRFW